MKRISNPTPKVEQRGEAVVPTETDIERRARELARIAGRKEVSEDDLLTARAEFNDDTLPDPVNQDADSMQSMSRDPSDPPADRGHQAPEYIGQDEKTDLERLALEGVEEAQHEQMLAARRARTSGSPSPGTNEG